MRLLTAILVSLATLSALAQVQIIGPNGGPTTFGGGAYSYDPAGNITAIDSQTFTYDVNGRLTQATVMAPDGTMVTQSYTYDVYGNLLSMTKSNVTTTINVDSATNHLSAGATYDEAGNVTQWNPPGSAVTYKYGWDALGNLQSIRLASDPAANPPDAAYLYTASDERLSTFDVPNNSSHWMVRDLGGQVLTDFLDKAGAWEWKRDYFYRDGTLLAAALPDLVQHYTVDHLGTPRLITDDTGTQIAAQTFLPFGEELQATFGNGGAIKKFTGHERDSDPGLTGTSLDYMHARYYNGGVGRFLSVDPVLGTPGAPQSWNRYAYVTNNPIGRTDPNGRQEAQAIGLMEEEVIPAVEEYGGEVIEGIKDGAQAAYQAVNNATTYVGARFPGWVDAARGWLQGETGTPSPPAPKVAPYAVGTVEELRAGSVPGDKIDIHHAPQAKPAGQVIKEYDPKTAPGIRTSSDPDAEGYLQWHCA